jgi:hypothetical protein
VGVWPVFLAIEMYQDHGNQFAVGDVIAWEVRLVDGELQGWPTERLVDSTARIIPRPVWAVRGSLADTGAVRICWCGPEPVGFVLVLKAGLVADFWNPPIPTTILATIDRIEVVRQSSALNPSGVWMPSGAWCLTPVQRTPPLRGVHRNHPGAERDVGLLFTVEVSSSTTRTYEEIGTGVGDPGTGPGIERTRPRA